MSQARGREFGSGVLARAALFIYWHLVVGALLCAGTFPTGVLLFFLARSVGNVPLVPLCAILLAPALSAGMYALNDRSRADGLSPAPARSFLRGLRLGWADALRAWTPPMAVLAIVAGGIVAVGAGGIPGGYAGVLIGIGVIVLLWGVNALVIATFFSFRWRDTARLAVYYLGRRWIVTLGELALLIVAVAVVFFTTEAVLWLCQVVWVAFLVVIARPLIADVTARFTAG
ncbi:glycosyltransferase [Microbacterium karelineae]|uniref:glycosyltransferase n=1 Tax=Microbacterium karelineae TaxID=2654283 RepID=UPI001E34519B|nr:glycosyltransferase [Microbacterium karelineae]